MDTKLQHPRFVLRKTPQIITPIKREITIFTNVSKIANFRQISKGKPFTKVSKMP